MRDRRVAYGRGLGILEHALNFLVLVRWKFCSPGKVFGFGENQSKCVILNSLLNVFFFSFKFYLGPTSENPSTQLERTP